MKDLSVLSFVSFVLAIIYLKMILEKFPGPTDLTKAQILYIYKTTKFFVIFKY